MKPEEKLLAAAFRYINATATIRKLTELLGQFDEVGALIRCTHPRRESDGEKGLGIDCRKWNYQPDGYDIGVPESGRGGWYSHRAREDWCEGCIEVQRIVDERRIAKRARGAALTQLGNIARGIQARENRKALEPF